MGARVAGIWRYPVKSMLGEPLDECQIGPMGLRGDRAFALIDQEDGKVASAKNPRKWAALLSCRARYLDDESAEIILPGGSGVRSDDPAVDDRLSAVLGRPVHLASTAPAQPVFEEVWPDIEGLAPEQVIAGLNIGTDPDGERISQFPLAGAAPAGTFFDVALLHLLTTSTLARLSELNPEADFDVRRYRPNLLIQTDGEPGFPENEWMDRTLAAAAGGFRAKVSVLTMRCVMTTLAQADLAADRGTLRTIAAHNRVDIPGWGTWACAGAYADVAEGGLLKVGDELVLT